MHDHFHHVLPGEEGGDTNWFFSQNVFERQEILRQVAYKRSCWPKLDNGRSANRPQHSYPHILPIGHVDKAFYEPFAKSILAYLKQENIALHSEVLNLKSSQVACMNFLFPFYQDHFLAMKVFREMIPGLDVVDAIEFEYSGPIEATKWLGEPLSGMRGQNRTSIDAALFWKDKNLQNHVTFIEWKYTEHNYGKCSAYSGGKPEEKEICRSLCIAEEDDPSKYCLLTSGKRHRSRRYWEHLESAGISFQAYQEVQGCPFRGPLYQLLRQHLLGTFLIKSHIVNQFEVVSMDFTNNISLRRVPKYLRLMANGTTYDVIDLWNRLLVGNNKMRHIPVEELMGNVDNVGIIDVNWREYISERYGV